MDLRFHSSHFQPRRKKMKYVPSGKMVWLVAEVGDKMFGRRMSMVRALLEVFRYRNLPIAVRGSKAELTVL